MIRAISYIFERFVLRCPYLYLVAKPFGLKFKVKAEDVVGRRIYKTGSYEKNISDYLVGNLVFSEGDIAIDAGANIGWYSLLFARISGDQNPVYAFEPDTRNFELLSNNIAVNKVKNVYPQKLAVSDVSGKQNLYRYNANNFGRHSLLPLNDEDVIEVDTVTLDEFFSQPGLQQRHVRILKVDIEGYEYNAFLGARELLSRTDTLLMEFSPQHMRDYGTDPELLIRLLVDYGFAPHILDNASLQAIELESLSNLDRQLNLVWKNNRYAGNVDTPTV